MENVGYAVPAQLLLAALQDYRDMRASGGCSSRGGGSGSCSNEGGSSGALQDRRETRAGGGGGSSGGGGGGGGRGSSVTMLLPGPPYLGLRWQGSESLALRGLLGLPLDGPERNKGAPGQGQITLIF